MSKKYVPEGTYLACSKGTCPSQLRVSNNKKTSIYGAAMATEADMFPFFNLKPMGFCTDIKKIASTGIMCIPAITKWKDPKEGVTINGNKMLLEDSTCKCILGDGDISIHFDVTSANKVALWGGAKMPTEYIKEGFDWAFANINENRAARDAALPNWAQGVAHVSDWFEDLTVSLVEGAANGVVGLGEVVYQVAKDPVGMTEAIGGMLNDAHKWKTEKEMQAIAWASKGENWSNAAEGLWKTATETDWTQAFADGVSATWQGTKDVANWVADNPRKIGEPIGEFLPDVAVAVYSGGTSLAATAGKKAVKEVGEEVVEEAVEKAIKETVEEGLEAGGKKALKEGIEEIGKEEADNIAKVVAKEKGGAKGGWNKTLNGKLKPNAIYDVDGYLYHTDDLGRVTKVEGKLSLNPRGRNTYQQGKSVKIKDGIDGDQGGHLIGDRFNGPGEQINYVPQKGSINQGAYKKMENEWAKAIDEGKDVKVEIKNIYEGTSKRPVGQEVDFYIDGVKNNKTFVN